MLDAIRKLIAAVQSLLSGYGAMKKELAELKAAETEVIALCDSTIAELKAALNG